jgi:hypothetical protein
VDRKCLYVLVRFDSFLVMERQPFGNSGNRPLMGSPKPLSVLSFRAYYMGFFNCCVTLGKVTRRYPALATRAKNLMVFGARSRKNSVNILCVVCSGCQVLWAFVPMIVGPTLYSDLGCFCHL